MGAVLLKETLCKLLLVFSKFHQGVIPPTAGLFAEPELLAAYRNSLNRQGKGPHLSMKVVEEYIRSEQELGRIDAHVDARLAASLMMSSSFFRAFIEEFFGNKIQPAWHEFARQLVATVAPEPSKE